MVTQGFCVWSAILSDSGLVRLSDSVTTEKIIELQFCGV